jgi:hypothetical protein
MAEAVVAVIAREAFPGNLVRRCGSALRECGGAVAIAGGGHLLDPGAQPADTLPRSSMQVRHLVWHHLPGESMTVKVTTNLPQADTTVGGAQGP